MAWREEKPFSKWLKPQLAVIAVAALVTWMFVRGSSGADLSGWHTTLASAEAASAESGRPILAYFSAAWCGPCQMFKSQTLKAPGVMDRLEAGFELAYLDVTDDTSPGVRDGRRHDVRSIPTLILMQPNGVVIDRVSGFMPPDDFVRWISPHAATSADRAGP